MKKNIHKGGTNNTLAITNDSGSSDNNKTMPLPIKRLPYDVKIFSFLCILGILVRMIFAKVPNDYATATVYGYSFSILALFGLLVSSFADIFSSCDDLIILSSISVIFLT